MTRNRVSGGSFSLRPAGLIVGENFKLGRVKLACQKSQRLTLEPVMVNERITRLSLKFFDFTALPLLQQTYKQGS
jgi:hypothetical protein